MPSTVKEEIGFTDKEIGLAPSEGFTDEEIGLPSSEPEDYTGWETETPEDVAVGESYANLAEATRGVREAQAVERQFAPADYLGRVLRSVTDPLTKLSRMTGETAVGAVRDVLSEQAPRAPHTREAMSKFISEEVLRKPHVPSQVLPHTALRPGGIPEEAVRGLGEMVPAIVGTAAGVPPSAAFGGLFGAKGFSETGDIGAAGKEAFIGAVLPSVGRMSKTVAGTALSHLRQAGLGSRFTEKTVEELAHQAGLNAFMNAMSAPELYQQFRDNPKEAFKTLAHNAGVLFGMSLMGVARDMRPEVRSRAEQIYAQRFATELPVMLTEAARTMDRTRLRPGAESVDIAMGQRGPVPGLTLEIPPAETFLPATWVQGQRVGLQKSAQQLLRAARKRRQIEAQRPVVAQPKETERIVAVASRVGETVETGPIHVAAEKKLRSKLGIGLDDPRVEDIEHGFLTDTGRFVGREEAFEIAQTARQLKSTVEDPGFLGKEDLKKGFETQQPKETDASQIAKTTKVHEPVPPQPREGEQAVPPAEGGKGVQAPDEFRKEAGAPEPDVLLTERERFKDLIAEERGKLRGLQGDRLLFDFEGITFTAPRDASPADVRRILEEKRKVTEAGQTEQARNEAVEAMVQAGIPREEAIKIAAEGEIGKAETPKAPEPAAKPAQKADFQPPPMPRLKVQKGLTDEQKAEAITQHAREVAAYRRQFNEWEKSLPKTERLLFEDQYSILMVTPDPKRGWRVTRISKVDQMPTGHSEYKTRLDALNEVRSATRIDKMPFEVKPLPPREMPEAAPKKKGKPGPMAQAEAQRGFDLIDLIQGHMTGKISIESAREIDPHFTPTGALRKLFGRRAKGAKGLDLAQQAADQASGGKYGDMSPSEFLSALEAAKEGRIKQRERFFSEQRKMTQAVQQSEAWEKSQQAKNAEGVPAMSLFEGDTFTVKGETVTVRARKIDEDGNFEALEIDGGNKFGDVTLTGRDTVRIDPGSLKENVEARRKETPPEEGEIEFAPEEQLAEAIEPAKPEPVPKPAPDTPLRKPELPVEKGVGPHPEAVPPPRPESLPKLTATEITAIDRRINELLEKRGEEGPGLSVREEVELRELQAKRGQIDLFSVNSRSATEARIKELRDRAVFLKQRAMAAAKRGEGKSVVAQWMEQAKEANLKADELESVMDTAKRQQQAESGELPMGPGAARPGDVGGMRTQIEQLAEAMSGVKGRKAPLKERLRDAVNATEAKSKAKSAIGKMLDGLLAVPTIVRRALDPVAEFDEFKSVLGFHSANIEERSWHARRFVKRARKAIPNLKRRHAISAYVDAGGDMATLQRGEAEAPAYLKQAYRDAQRLTADEKITADNISQYFESMLAEAQAAGVLDAGLESYIHRIFRRESPVKERIIGEIKSGILSTYTPNFAKRRFFEFDFEAAKAGLKPEQDFIQRVLVYQEEMSRVLANRETVRRLMELRDPDGRPVIDVAGMGSPLRDAVTDEVRTHLIRPSFKPGLRERPGRPLTEEEQRNTRKDYVDRSYPALKRWRWAENAEERPLTVSEIAERDARIASATTAKEKEQIRREYEKLVEGKPILVQGDVLIHPKWVHRVDTLLAPSLVRQRKLGRGALALSSTIKQTMLDLSLFHQVQIAVHGLEHKVNPFRLVQDVDFTNPKVVGLVRGGLTLGGEWRSQNYSEGLVGRSLTRHVPGLGPVMETYHEWLFQNFIPRVKMTMALHALDRNRQRFADDLTSGRMTEEQLHFRTAKEANAAFGGQNYTMMERSKTVQDLARLIFLAPDFLEARFRFVAQALQKGGKSKLGPLGSNEQRTALFLGAATMWVLARIANKLIDDQYHFEPENLFAVVINKHRYSLRTVQGDVLHLLDKPVQFWMSRLNPVYGRTFLEVGTGRDYFGRKRSAMEQVQDFVSTAIPISLRSNKERHVWESFLNATGVTARRYNDVDDAFKLARKWKDKHGVQERGEFIYDSTKDPLRPLKVYLSENDELSASKEIKKLIEDKTYTWQRLNDYFDRYARMPFTGSVANDKKWMETLSQDELTTVRAAKEHKQAVRKLYIAARNRYRAALATRPAR